MPLSRRRELGFHHHNTECLILVVILGILGAVAIPPLLRFRARHGAACLDQLVAHTEGRRAPGAACPYGGAAYGEAAACPSPAEHLDSAPRFVQTSEGGWRLEQTLPEIQDAPVVLGAGASDARREPGRAVIHVKPGGFTKYVLGPVLTLVFAALWIFSAALLLGALFKRAWADAVFPLLGVAGWGFLAALNFLSCAESRQWTFEPGRATRIVYLLGFPRSTTSWTGCQGVVPVSSHAKKLRFLQLVHAADVDGRRLTPVDTVPAERLDVARWINRALGP